MLERVAQRTVQQTIASDGSFCITLQRTVSEACEDVYSGNVAKMAYFRSCRIEVFETLTELRRRLMRLVGTFTLL